MRSSGHIRVEVPTERGSIHVYWSLENTDKKFKRKVTTRDMDSRVIKMWMWWLKLR